MDTNHIKKEDLPNGFAQTLHERSRESANDRRKLLITLGTGGIGIFFIVIASKIDPPLVTSQKMAALFSVIFLALTVISGICAIHSDARRNYYWASALNAAEIKDIDRLKKIRDKWNRRKKTFDFILYVSFILAILSSFVFILMRIV